MEEKIIKTEYSDTMQKSFINYAMSVIIARALPDVRDGLKPVQRRTLYDMYELGIRYDRPYRKSARIVGDTMGKYHPHGDSSIYDALVVMAQDFKKEIPLVDGHGNFGNIEGDGAAAMRYTEARLQKITQDAMLADLDKDVVDFVPNFDETEKEPSVLPCRFPNLLVNGSGVGTVSYVTGKGSATGTLNILQVKEGYSLQYFYYLLKVFNFEPYKTGMAIPHIYFKDYGKAKVFCPSYTEQLHYARLLSAIDNKLSIEQSILTELSLQKQYLLCQMFI